MWCLQIIWSIGICFYKVLLISETHFQLSQWEVNLPYGFAMWFPPQLESHSTTQPSPAVNSFCRVMFKQWKHVPKCIWVDWATANELQEDVWSCFKSKFYTFSILNWNSASLCVVIVLQSLPSRLWCLLAVLWSPSFSIWFPAYFGDRDWISYSLCSFNWIQHPPSRKRYKELVNSLLAFRGSISSSNWVRFL